MIVLVIITLALRANKLALALIFAVVKFCQAEANPHVSQDQDIFSTETDEFAGKQGDGVNKAVRSTIEDVNGTVRLCGETKTEGYTASENVNVKDDEEDLDSPDQDGSVKVKVKTTVVPVLIEAGVITNVELGCSLAARTTESRYNKVVLVADEEEETFHLKDPKERTGSVA